MTIPRYDELMPGVVECLADGETHTMSDLVEFCAKKFHVTEEERKQQISSGGLLFKNRVSWAKAYLKQAGLLEIPKRGRYRLTKAGKKAYADGPNKITLAYLKQFKSFVAFISGGKKDSDKPLEENSQAESPQEMISNAINKINSALADDLMTEILKMSPYDFERLVVKLLIKMGYGSFKLNPDAVTTKSNDGGIDGIVKADKLGFDSIYIQAKKWKPGSVVGRPALQQFAGAILSQGDAATKGIFITTADFSAGAVDFVDRQSRAKIILINGELLTRLMIEYNLGVSTAEVYEVKRLDYDFFNEDE